jgi:tRNA-dihydrouridine synthase B
MIGRAAMGNPWIFGAILDHLEGREPKVPSVAEKISFLRGYALDLAEHLPAKAVPGRVKRLASQFTKGLPGGGRLRTAIFRSSTVPEVLGALAAYEGGDWRAEAVA